MGNADDADHERMRTPGPGQPVRFPYLDKGASPKLGPQFHRKPVSVYTSFRVLYKKKIDRKMKGTSSQSRRNLFKMTGALGSSSSSSGKTRNY